MNTRTVNTVIIFLGLVAVGVVAGGFVLAYNDKTIPEALIAMGSAAAGAIAALLARPPADAPAVAQALATAAAPPPPEIPDFGPLLEALSKVSGPVLALAQAHDAAAPKAVEVAAPVEVVGS